MEPEGHTGVAVFFAIILFLIVGVGGGFWYFFLREGKSPFPTNTAAPSFAPRENGTGSTGGQRLSGDINDDGAITNTDVQMVRDQIGCTSNDTCWEDVIGKTLSGDNPIYTSDLDLNNDSQITEVDVQVIAR